jgi:hypothetical protein
VDSIYSSESELCGGAVTSLYRSISLGKRCTSYNAPPTSRKRAADRWSLRNFLPRSSLLMVGKAQKSHGACMNWILCSAWEKEDRWNPLRTSAVRQDIVSSFSSRDRTSWIARYRQLLCRKDALSSSACGLAIKTKHPVHFLSSSRMYIQWQADVQTYTSCVHAPTFLDSWNSVRSVTHLSSKWQQFHYITPLSN